MDTINAISTPMLSGTIPSAFQGEVFPDLHLYRSTVGALQYVTIARPEIAYSVNKLCQFMRAPKLVHWQAVKKLLHYLRGTIDDGLLLSKPKDLQLQSYVDADWASDPDDRKSTSGTQKVFHAHSLLHLLSRNWNWNWNWKSSISNNSNSSTLLSSANTQIKFSFITLYGHGAAFAKHHTNNNHHFSSPSSSFLQDLPENCIWIILTKLDPPEICKLATLNRAFRAASSADFIWESKLPSNCTSLLRALLHPQFSLPNNKHIFAALTRPNLFDAGTKEFWLDKRSAKTFLSISSKALKITGIHDRRYWNYIPTHQSRFGSVAYLKQIWWVEIGGEVEFEFPPGGYSLYFRLHLGKPSPNKFGRRTADMEHVHGWDLKPVSFQLSVSSGHKATSECYLQQSGSWVFYHVGDFGVEAPNFTAHINFSMLQIDCTHTKGGLSVDSVFICPSEFKSLY
ncbi:F-box protein PP2-A13-like [Momordica charantia]|uniref:F-box protein PP2-A13-like n=1 Tax=Momordica charantia TaxID=3673 RepID=A0A6J1DZW7_MOMCH|nr:F-box protein PP2-A13-like [Momordica charantia]